MIKSCIVKESFTVCTQIGITWIVEAYVEAYKNAISDCEVKKLIDVCVSNHVLQIKRGLISTPPSHMLGDDTPAHRIGAWTRVRNCGVFQKPRLFLPYYDEAKVSDASLYD